MVIIATYWPGHDSAGSSLGVRLFTLVATLGAIAFLVRLVKRLPNKPNSSERKEAVRLGIVVSVIERDLPQFTRGNQSWQLVRGSCVKYSLPRCGECERSTWSMLQRTEGD